MKVYIETWETNDGLRLDIAFTQYEMEEMSVDYKCAKRNNLADTHGFNISCASRIMTRIIDRK